MINKSIAEYRVEVFEVLQEIEESNILEESNVALIEGTLELGIEEINNILRENIEDYMGKLGDLKDEMDHDEDGNRLDELILIVDDLISSLEILELNRVICIKNKLEDIINKRDMKNKFRTLSNEEAVRSYMDKALQLEKDGVFCSLSKY